MVSNLKVSLCKRDPSKSVKITTVNLSDIFAMGALPHSYLLNLYLPNHINENWLNLFSIKFSFYISVEVASHSPDKNIFLELSLISRFKFKSFDGAKDFFRSISKNKN